MNSKSRSEHEMSRNKCVIFDLDGTLIESRYEIAYVINELRKHFGRPPLPDEEIASYTGNGILKLVERAFHDAPEKIAEAQASAMGFYQANLGKKTTLYPGVKDGLRRLHEAGYKLGVASNKPHTLCIPLLDILEIGCYISAVEGGNTGLAMKPDPAQLFSILQKTDSDPASSWMFGDNYTDLAAGKAAGMKTGFAAYGFGDPKDYTWDFRAENFSEFTDHLTNGSAAV